MGVIRTADQPQEVLGGLASAAPLRIRLAADDFQDLIYLMGIDHRIR
jgi:hypothetical protein